MNNVPVGKSAVVARWEGALCASILWMVLGLCVQCDRQSSGGSQPLGAGGPWDAVMQQQAQEYDRQVAMARRQLEETERQLAQSDRNLRTITAQNEAFGELLVRWSAQADRVDNLLERWERIAGTLEQRVLP